MKTFRRMEKKEKKKKKRRIETKGEVGKTKRKREKKIKNERNWKNTIFLDKYAKFIPRWTSPFLFRGIPLFNPLCSPIFESSLTSSSSLNVKKKEKRHAPRSRRVARLFHHLGREKKRLLKRFIVKATFNDCTRLRHSELEGRWDFSILFRYREYFWKILSKNFKIPNTRWLYSFFFFFPSSTAIRTRDQRKREKRNISRIKNNNNVQKFLKKKNDPSSSR